MSLNSELNKMGASIVKDAIKNAKPNKKTGRLERSIGYTVNGNTVSISEESYGKYLNNQTKFMDKAVNNNIDKGANAIANAVADDIINDLNKKL